MTYLDMVEEIVIMAGERGIYSLLDMHQDAFNAKFCGNGVPDWAAKPVADNFPYPLQVKTNSIHNSPIMSLTLPRLNMKLTRTTTQAVRTVNPSAGLTTISLQHCPSL